MERGAINGLPVWVRLSELTNQERLVVKEAPDVDGAIVEPQGQMPSRYRLEFMLINDGEWITSDYETASLDLRSMFLGGGPFTVSIPVLGEITDLWMEEPVTLKFFDESRRTVSEGSVGLIEGRSQLILAEDAAAAVENAIARLSEAAVLDFGDRAPAAGFFDGAIDVLDAFGQWLSDTQGLISSAFEPVNNFSASIQILRSQLQTLLLTPQNFASRVMSTAGGLLSLVPSLSRQGDPRLGSAAVQDSGNDKPSVTFIEALLTGAAFDDDVPPTQGEVLGEDLASDEDRTELDEVESARSLALTAVTAAVCLAVTSTKFATVNSILNLSDALEVPFEELFAIPSISYAVYSEARALRASTRQYLSEQAVGLPRLRSYTTVQTESLLSVLPELYESLASEDEVQLAVDSLANLNSVPKPWAVPAETTLLFLDPLVA